MTSHFCKVSGLAVVTSTYHKLPTDFPSKINGVKQRSLTHNRS